MSTTGVLTSGSGAKLQLTSSSITLFSRDGSRLFLAAPSAVRRVGAGTLAVGSITVTAPGLDALLPPHARTAAPAAPPPPDTAARQVRAPQPAAGQTTGRVRLATASTPASTAPAPASTVADDALLPPPKRRRRDPPVPRSQRAPSRSQLRHFKVIWAICFIVRVLLLARPLLITTRSSKVSNLLRTNRFANVFKTDSPLLDDFLNVARATTHELLAAIIVTITGIIWRETETPEWIETVGTIAVVQYGPKPDCLALHVPTLDEGAVKYDPALQDEAVTLVRASLAKAAVVRRALAQAVEGLAQQGQEVPSEPAARRAWLRSIRALAEAEAARTGVEGALDAARTAYAQRRAALTGLRSLSAVYRAEERALDKGGSLSEILRKRSNMRKQQIAEQSKGALFEGSPLSPFAISRLSEHYNSSGILDVNSLPPSLLIQYPRLAALVPLLREHDEAALDGRPSPLPLILIGEIGSPKYVSWFLSRPEGVEILRSAGGMGTGRGGGEWTDERREKARKRQQGEEEGKRIARGTSLVGELALEEALQALEKGGLADSGYGARRDLLAAECGRCGDVFLARRNKLVPAAHGCGAHDPSARYKTIHILYPITIKYLDGRSFPLPTISAIPLVTTRVVNARSLISPSLLRVLPFDPNLDPQLVLDQATTSSPRAAQAAALDALLIESSLNAGSLEIFDDDASVWDARSGQTVQKLLQLILDEQGVRLFRCSTCSAERLSGGSGAAPQCAHSQGGGGGGGKQRMSLVPSLRSGESLLALPLPLLRRWTFAFGADDALLQNVVAGNKGRAEEIEAAALKMWRWRQP
ncbi:hypothetical protein JCM10450v2_003081 [Rhodotorula kratochvilovae]